MSQHNESPSSIEATFLCLTYDGGNKALLVDVVCDGERIKTHMKAGLTKGLTALGLVTGDRFRCVAKVKDDRLTSPSKFESLGAAKNSDKVRLLAEKLYWDDAKDEIDAALASILSDLEVFQQELSSAWRTRRSDPDELENVLMNPPDSFFDDVSDCCTKYGVPELSAAIQGRFQSPVGRLSALAERACDAVIDEDGALTEQLISEIRQVLKDLKKLCSAKQHNIDGALQQKVSTMKGRTEKCVAPPPKPKKQPKPPVAKSASEQSRPQVSAAVPPRVPSAPHVSPAVERAKRKSSGCMVVLLAWILVPVAVICGILSLVS